MSPRAERTPSPRPSGRLACLEAPEILAQRLAPGRATPRRAVPALEDPHLGRLRTEEEESDATTSESEEEANVCVGRGRQFELSVPDNVIVGSCSKRRTQDS